MAKIDVTEQVHALLKVHCKEHRVFIKDFVSNLVLRELSPVDIKPRVQSSAPAPAADDPWTKPPFWNCRGKNQ